MKQPTKLYSVNIPAAAAGAFRVGKPHRLGDTHLYHGETSIMSDRALEFAEAIPFLDAAHGDVLCAGLGLGVLHKALMENEKVRSVTIVEKYQDVIDLVWDHCEKDDRFRLINADIYDVHFDKNNDLFDVGWFDSWTSETGEPDNPLDPYNYQKDMLERFEPFVKEMFFWKDYRKCDWIEQIEQD
tara:strand:- start:148 stop:702 length:555 start_codon:yes stop_codon:yes gene_type:complete